MSYLTSAYTSCLSFSPLLTRFDSYSLLISFSGHRHRIRAKSSKHPETIIKRGHQSHRLRSGASTSETNLRRNQRRLLLTLRPHDLSVLVVVGLLYTTSSRWSIFQPHLLLRVVSAFYFPIVYVVPITSCIYLHSLITFYLFLPKY
jgi:hypothetical protein